MPKHSPLGIRHIAYYAPETGLTNSALRERLEFEDSFLSEKLGILNRPMAQPEQATSDMCVEAVRNLSNESGFSPEEAECLIVVTQTPDYILPHTAALVQKKMSLPSKLATFDINLGCSGYVYGLSIIQGFMDSNSYSNGILITAEQYTKLLDQEDRNTVPIFGDAASASWITRENPAYTTGAFTFGTDGDLYDAIIVRGSGTEDGPVEPLSMNGRAVFTFMMSVLPGNIEQCLQDNQLKTAQIDSWVFHQASKYMLESLANRVGIPLSKVIIDIEDIGNTTSSSIPIALARKVFNQTDVPAHVFLSGFGVGASWCSNIIKRVENN